MKLPSSSTTFFNPTKTCQNPGIMLILRQKCGLTLSMDGYMISVRWSKAALFEPYLSAHPFWSITDRICIRSPIQPTRRWNQLTLAYSATCRRKYLPFIDSAACGRNQLPIDRSLPTACFFLSKPMEATPVHPGKQQAKRAKHDAADDRTVGPRS